MKVNIVSVWTWFANILDTQTLSASEQLILVHLIKILNRNFWKPSKISVSAICRSCGKDSRTVKRSLSLLKGQGFITETEEGITLNLGEERERGERQKKKPSQPRPSPNRKAGDLTKLNERVRPEELNEESQIEKELKEGKLSERSKEILKTLSPELRERIFEKYKGIPLVF